MKVVIVEDEKLAAENLIHLLEESAYKVEVLAVLDTVKAAVNWFRKNEAELVFMDIQLGDANSFSIFEEVQINSPVIFTSAYDQYALKAFKQNSIDYLLKPLDKEELNDALAKFMKQAPPALDIHKLLENFSQKKPEYQHRFMLSSGQKIRSVEVAEILCFYAEGRYVSILDTNGQSGICDYTLEKLEKLLDPDDFFRINRSVIINFKAIRQIHQYPKSRYKIDLKKEAGLDLVVSAERASEFRSWLNR